jgi:hypothetical protein
MRHFKIHHLRIAPTVSLPVHVQRWMDDVRIKKMLAKDAGVKEHQHFYIPDELLTLSPPPSFPDLPSPSMSPSPTPSLRSVSPTSSSGSSAPSYTPNITHAQLVDFSSVTTDSHVASASSWAAPDLSWVLPEEKLYLSPMPPATKILFQNQYTYQHIQFPQIPQFDASIPLIETQPQFNTSLTLPALTECFNFDLNDSELSFNSSDSAEWPQVQAHAPEYNNDLPTLYPPTLYTPTHDVSFHGASLDDLFDPQFNLPMGTEFDSWFSNGSNGLGLQLGPDVQTTLELGLGLV